jgi:MtN3 and saliva related transmembrane protein
VTETALGVVAASWGVVMALSPTLQIRRILRRRSSADVSVGYLSILVVGFFLWVGYGAAMGNPILIVPNTLAFLVGVATILVAVRFRSPRP